jgi:hypothetical protein
MKKMHGILTGGIIIPSLLLSGCHPSPEQFARAAGAVPHPPTVVSLPVYPGSKDFWDYPARPQNPTPRIFTYKAPAPPLAVTDYYKKELLQTGWSVMKEETRKGIDGIPEEPAELRRLNMKSPLARAKDLRGVSVRAVAGKTAKWAQVEIRLLTSNRLNNSTVLSTNPIHRKTKKSDNRKGDVK